jgi:hypothetical protein
MMQFRGYDGLSWRFYDEDGERTLPLLVTWVEALKETLEGDKVGPRVPVFFAGGPYGNGMQKYYASRNWKDLVFEEEIENLSRETVPT